MFDAGALAQSLINALMGALPALMEAATTGLAQLTTLWATADWTAMTATIQRSDLNFMTRMPPGLSYNLGGVMELYNQWEPALLGAGALACVAGAIGVLGRTYFGWSWQLGEWSTRLVIGLMLGSSAPRLYQVVIDASNRICDAIITAPMMGIPSVNEVDPVTGAIILAVWVVLGFRLLVRMGYGLVYFDLLLAVGPIALAGYMIPGGETYAKFWVKAFFGLRVGQVLVAVCLRLATSMSGLLGATFAALALVIGTLLLAYDVATMFAEIKGGGLGRMVRDTTRTIALFI